MTEHLLNHPIIAFALTAAFVLAVELLWDALRWWRRLDRFAENTLAGER